MTDQYPPGFEPGANPDRINGFARGDRVQVINEDMSSYYGKIGHVVNSFAGCDPKECSENGFCKLIEVDLDGKPPWASYTRCPLFNPKDLVHID